MKLFYKQVGENGTPIIILHGIFGSSDNWLTIGKVLGETHQIFIIDQRNHGQSPRSEDFDYKDEKLKIIFQDNIVYEYFGVPKNTYVKFVNAPSVARFAKRHIYNSFTFRNVSK